MKMRYLVFTEYNPEEAEAVIKEDAAFQADRAIHPEKYPRYAITSSSLGSSLPHLSERIQFVDVVEADDPEQMMNYRAHKGAQTTLSKSYKSWYISLQEYSDAFAAELALQYRLVAERKEQFKTTR